MLFENKQKTRKLDYEFADDRLLLSFTIPRNSNYRFGPSILDFFLKNKSKKNIGKHCSRAGRRKTLVAHTSPPAYNRV